jgi:hypothetical protein
MIMNRRIFIQTALVAAPTLRALPPPSKPLPTSQASPLSAQEAGGGADMNRIVFRIDGWDRGDAATNNQVSIRINQSWRTAWR